MNKTTENPQRESLELLSLNSVERRLSLSKSTIYREIAKGHFPKQIRLSPGRVGWIDSEVDEWIEERRASRKIRSKRKT